MIKTQKILRDINRKEREKQCERAETNSERLKTQMSLSDVTKYLIGLKVSGERLPPDQKK